MKDDDMKSPVGGWIRKIDESLKREKDWRKEGKAIFDIYENKEEQDFNILFSNVETVRPSLFFQEPNPYVKRRFPSADPEQKEMDTLVREAAETIEKAISYTLDDYDFYQEAGDAITDLLLPGRAVIKVEYDPSIATDPDNPENEYVDDEKVTCKYWPWDRFTHGEGRRWRQVQWMAYEHHLDKHNFQKKFKGIEFKPDVAEGEIEEGQTDTRENTLVKVWEIWDKSDRKVKYMAPSIKDKLLREDDDPLGLGGFFNTPKPLFSANSTRNLIPVPDYKTYQAQAEELSAISFRIRKIIKGVKMRGIYDATMTEMQSLMNAQDNELVPSNDAKVAIDMHGGLDKAVWLWPVETAAKVLASLYMQRDQIKQVIYEITGLSDILRGSSDPNETLGAQELKAQTGSLRIQKRQRDIQRYFRDIIRIKAEIISEHYSPGTIEAMVGKKLDPRVFELLKNDMFRRFKIDIETDSTISPNLQREQENVTKALAAISEYAASMAPLVQQGMVPDDAAKTIFQAAVRKFNFGREIEDMFDEPEEQQEQIDPQMVEQEVQQRVQQEIEKFMQSPEALKVQAETQKIQAEAQAKGQEMQTEQQIKAMEMQARQQEMEATQQTKGIEMQTKAEEIAANREAAALERQVKAEQLNMDREFAAAKHAQRMLELQYAAEEATKKDSLSSSSE